MRPPAEFRNDTASAAEIARHLWLCDADYMPRLSSRVSIDAYAAKLAKRATLFEAWVEDELVGLVAAYCDLSQRTAFITNVSVAAAHRACGIASRLLATFLTRAQELKLQRVELEVNPGNHSAATLYTRHGFVSASAEDPARLVMCLSDDTSPPIIYVKQ